MSMSISKNSGHKARNIAVFLTLLGVTMITPVEAVEPSNNNIVALVGSNDVYSKEADNPDTATLNDLNLTLFIKWCDFYKKSNLSGTNFKQSYSEGASNIAHISSIKNREEYSIFLRYKTIFENIEKGCPDNIKKSLNDKKVIDALILETFKEKDSLQDYLANFYYEEFHLHDERFLNFLKQMFKNRIFSELQEPTIDKLEKFKTIFSEAMEKNFGTSWDDLFETKPYKFFRNIEDNFIKKNKTQSIKPNDIFKCFSTDNNCDFPNKKFNDLLAKDLTSLLIKKIQEELSRAIDFLTKRILERVALKRQEKKEEELKKKLVDVSWQRFFKQCQRYVHPDKNQDANAEELLSKLSPIVNDYFGNNQIINVDSIVNFKNDIEKNGLTILECLSVKKAAKIEAFFQTLDKIEKTPNLKYSDEEISTFKALIETTENLIVQNRQKNPVMGQQQTANITANNTSNAVAASVTAPTTTSTPITVNPTPQSIPATPVINTVNNTVINTVNNTVNNTVINIAASNTANTTSFQHAERSAYWDYHKSTDSVYTKDHFGGQYDHGVTQYAFQQMGEKNQSGQQNINLIVQDDQQGGEKTMAAKEFLQDLTGLNGVMTTDKKSIPEITTVSAVKKSKSELEKSLKRSIPLLKKRVSKNPLTAALAHQTKQQKFYQIRDHNPSGQQNIALIAQDDQQGGEKTMTVKEFLQDLTGQNGVMMAAKKSIPEITSMSDVRKSKSELEKLMKRVELLFKKRVSKNPRTAALAHQTKQQNQWVTSVNNWLTTLNQADKSANRLTINPTEEHIILELSERKAIIKGFSGLLKDLNQQSKNILKANRDKKLEKQAQLRAKKESERLNKKSVSKKAPMESFGQINKGGAHRARRLDHLSAT